MLDSVKGRKHVVLFSEGFDGRLLLGRGPDAQDFEGQQDQFNIERGNLWMVDTDDIFGSTPLQNEMGSMLEEFRRADVVIQAVDISGLGGGAPGGQGGSGCALLPRQRNRRRVVPGCESPGDGS
jgi:hypothetical protein